MQVEVANIHFMDGSIAKLRLVEDWCLELTIRDGKHRDTVRLSEQGVRVNECEVVGWVEAMKALVLKGVGE